MKKEINVNETDVSSKKSRIKKSDKLENKVYSQKEVGEDSKKKLKKTNSVDKKNNDKLDIKVEKKSSKKKSDKVKEKKIELNNGSEKKKDVSSAVKNYQMRKKKKDKKKVKKRINGKFNLDIFDLLIMVVIVAIISCVSTGLILNYQYNKNYNFIDKSMVDNESVQEFLNTYTEILDNFYEEVDGDAMLKAAMEGMVNFLQDNYSIYLNKSASDDLTESLDGSYEGVGLLIRGTMVEDVYKKSPAEKAGIKVGDELLEVNGTEITLSNYGEISGLLKKDEENSFIVLRDKEKIEFKLRTAYIPATTTDVIVSPDKSKKIGYIYLDSFSKLAFEDFEVDLVKLEENENIDSLIIDLRGNKGGYLNVAKDIASLFLEKGEVIYSLENKNEITTYKDETKDKRSYPIVVLVDSLTASSAEILTAALKDSYGATIVGTKTYGKGKVQTMKKYGDSIIKYTSAKWLRPNGDCVDEVGIEPDYKVNVSVQGNKYYDLQLDKGIELLSK